ncbi:MAG: hypothetical protein H0V68_11860 [Actinobacteria bacterium]|nr:hypothetical protein [Actinomycetota bacterium]
MIGELLHQLESEERAISRRRHKLHARIATFPDTTGSWAKEELELSKKRRALHRQIDQLRARAEESRRPAGRRSSNVQA